MNATHELPSVQNMLYYKRGCDVLLGIFASSSLLLKGISAEFQVIRGFSQKIPADLLSYDKIHS